MPSDPDDIHDKEKGISPFLDRHSPIEDPQPKRDVPDTNPHPQGNTGKTLARWQAPEYPRERAIGSGALVTAVAVFIGLVAYAIHTDSPLMAIVFILIGMISYLSLNREPELIVFSITTKGITTGKEFYEYEHLRSFWITEDHPDIPKELLIETTGTLVQHVPIPLADQNVDAIRSLLITHLPEKKYEPGLIDTIGRILHI
jgi:hypothetical protein